MRTIAVVGATGLLGDPVTRALLDAGFEVRILARRPEQAWMRFEQRVTVVPGNLQSKESLKALLDGADGLYINLSVKPSTNEKDYQPEREGLKSLLEAAKGSNIKRIAYLSSLVYRYNHTGNFKWWVFDIKAQAVELIKGCGIPYTIFYPSTFMDNMTKGSMRMGHKILLSGESRFPMYFIAAADYAKQVALSFRLEKAANRDYVVQGPEAFTNDEAARIFVENYKKEELMISKPSIKWLRWLGKLLPGINYGYHIITAMNNYEEKFEAEATWKELGTPATTLSEFARSA